MGERIASVLRGTSWARTEGVALVSGTPAVLWVLK